MRIVVFAVWLGCAGGLGAQDLELRPIDPPAADGALAPDVGVVGDDVILSWLEPSETGHALRCSVLRDGAWSEPSTVTDRDDLFVNWADFPAIVPGVDGQWIAHWLQRSDEGRYAYGVQLARSVDEGQSWESLGWLHDDRTPTEHGFVSIVADETGFSAFWLDGRAMAEGGTMSLRTRRIEGELGPELVLDDDVCTCCQTDAVYADGSFSVVYRDRREGEVRDISVIRGRDDEWSSPASVHEDGWVIAGCPVNGPALTVAGFGTVATWFTAADGRARVWAAVEGQDGSFSWPAMVDGEAPLGRVAATGMSEGAAVAWMATDGKSATVRLRFVSSKGRLGDPVSVASMAASRASGFPRLAFAGGRLLVAWREVAEVSRLRAVSLDPAAIPRPAAKR